MTTDIKNILHSGLQEMDIHFDQSQLQLLLDFIQLIAKWNKTYNLTAIHSLADITKLHILDSLSVLPYISGSRVADIGTGAGLPGIPLAIFCPEKQFVLVDSNSKKTRFVQQAILELKLTNVTVVHSRVEKFSPESLFTSVIMRAFSSLNEITTLTKHLLEKQGIILAMKGQIPKHEIDSLGVDCSVFLLEIPNVEAARCLIRLEGLTQDG